MTMRQTDESLRQKAARLRLTYIRDNMPELMRAATESKMTPREVLDYVLSKEVDRRDANRVKLATMAAHFPRACTLENFDFAAQPAVDPGTIRELAKVEWVAAGENVLFLGPPGVGKTHLAIALGREAVKKGFSALFISASGLVSLLDKARRESMLDEKIAMLSKPQLLIIDEVGYLPISTENANLFFQLVSRRYERKSIILTSNRSLNDWGVIFGDPTVATAILDRLLHHCTPVNIMGDSYRLKEAKKDKLFKEK